MHIKKKVLIDKQVTIFQYLGSLFKLTKAAVHLFKTGV